MSFFRSRPELVDESVPLVAAAVPAAVRRSESNGYPAIISLSYSRILVIAAALLLTACSSAVTPEKISQIHTAMKPDEVKALLGPPAHIDQAETTGLSGEVYHYPAPNGEGRVVFLHDAVFKVEFVPGAKS